MSNPYFQFKNFTVYHDKCAMKVGTDGVLVGICANLSETYSVLDVGTGSGLIALILAQRMKDFGTIDAIDIDSNAIRQATNNILNSEFINIQCFQYSLQEYARICIKKYDLIISNPPYFSLSLHSPDSQRTLARHADSLILEEFIDISATLLSEKGRLFFIYPYSEKELIIKMAQKPSLFVSHITTVYPTPLSQPKRILIELSKSSKNFTTYQDLIIEEARHKYSSTFRDLAKDFYLNI